ncbi:MAG: sulfotransferase [Thermodesulfobacteriota bacterium]
MSTLPIKLIKWRIKGLTEYLKFHFGVFHTATTTLIPQKKQNLPLCFVAGCGRSGTTMLGRLLSLHPSVSYLNEPREFWATVSATTDIWGYTNIGTSPKSLLITSHKKKEHIRLFRLLSYHFDPGRHRVLVEKSPENVFRLQWLHAIAPQAKLIHIVRNGADVARSIMVEADLDIPYGLQDMNNWYGTHNKKRHLLQESAKLLGIPSSAVAACATRDDWAALEWICSLTAYRLSHHLFLDNGCYQLRYEDLLANPWDVFTELINFLGMPAAPHLKETILGYVYRRSKQKVDLVLAPDIKSLMAIEMTNFGYDDALSTTTPPV